MYKLIAIDLDGTLLNSYGEVSQENRKAIKYAIDMANKNDIIVLAGKGHETYQEINGKKYPFDEREIIKKLMK